MLNRIANWFSARDPGYIRLYGATRVIAAVLTALGLTTLLVKFFYQGETSGVMVFAMLITFFSLQMVTDAQPSARRRSLALAIIPISAGVVLAAMISGMLVLQAVGLVTFLFGSFYVRRYGVRPGELVLLAVVSFYLSIQFRVTTANLWLFLMAAAVGVASAILFMFILMPYRPLRSLRQAIIAFYLRAGEIVAQLSANLEQAPDSKNNSRLRYFRAAETGVRQLRATRRVIEGLVLTAISPQEWPRDLLARLQLDLYNAEQALEVMVESAAHLESVRSELPDGVRRSLTVGLRALHDGLSERVSAESSAAAAEALGDLRKQFKDSAASSVDSSWEAPVLSLAVAGTQLGQAAKSTRQNDPGEWSAQLTPMAAATAPAAPQAPGNLTFAGRPVHVTTALGIQAALAALLGVSLALLLGLPTPMTAFLSAFLVVSTTAGESVRKAWLRILGTIGGVVVGLFVGELLPDNLLVILGVVVMALFMAVYVTALSYNWMIFWITVAVMLPITLTPGLNIDAGIARIINITLGALAAVVVTATVFPLHTRARYEAALAGFLGAVDQHITLFATNLLHGQSMAMDDREYAISTAYGRLSALFPSAAFEYSPLSQRQTGLAAQATQLSALHSYVTHLADEIEVTGLTSNEDMRRTVISALQDEIHQNIQAIVQTLKGRGDSSQHMKKENIEALADGKELVDPDELSRSRDLMIAIGRLARIRSVILEIGTQRGIQTT